MATTKIRSSSITDGQVSNADLSSTIGVTGDQIADDAVTTRKILDNNVTLAKMVDGTQGGVIHYGAAGAPVELAAGTDGYFLKTQGAGANPVWASAGGTNVPQFSVYMSATIAIANDTWTLIPFDTADINDDGASGTCVNITASGTNPRGFTVPAGEAGKYCLSFFVQSYSIGNVINQCYATFYWANSGGTPANTWGYSHYNLNSGGSNTLAVPNSVMIIADLAVGDNVYVYGRVTEGGSDGRLTGGAQYTRFSGFKLLQELK